MRDRVRVAVDFVVVCAVVVATVVGATGAVGGQTTGVVPQTGDIDPDTVLLRMDVGPDGSANWTIEYRVRLDDANTTEAFEGLRADIEANESAYVSRFEGRMDRTVATAENATGREMAVQNVTVTAERRQLPQEYGIVSYRFRWVGFAAVDGDSLVIGDAIAGLFLDEETRLIVSWPATHEAVEVAPSPTERREQAAVWVGPVNFGPDQPRVVLRPAGSTGGLSTPALAGGALVVAGVLVGGIWYLRRYRGADDRNPTGGRGATETAAGDAHRSATDGSATPSANDDGASGADGESPGPPADLLSPEERVLQFLESRGGRVKQQEVVATFDWSAARTSQVVGSLRDEGKIETFRLGRENVITVPDADDEHE